MTAISEEDFSTTTPSPSVSIAGSDATLDDCTVVDSGVSSEKCSSSDAVPGADNRFEVREKLRLDQNDPDYQTQSPGVGPWEGEWPTDPRYDPDLLERGDRRNVVDKYRYWTLEAIKADLDTTRSELHIAIENLEHDLNIGSIVRTGNAFNVGAVHVVGRKKWNRRGAMVTDRYMHVHHHPDPGDLFSWAKENDYAVVAVDNMDGSTQLERTELPKRCVLVFGQESNGISPELLSKCEKAVYIPQFGSTRSMNVAAAAAIAMHWWIAQYRA
ncbi:TrmH family RNA methyltransferase [Arcanobacterium bovis]|uniref:TrmH family RNA methyltransferase n=1 Tax=Arcanobacterium bovis TaxID=2529275 RepID=A0A4Q9UZP7_9ACTO|nr:TrmH family RNA methyltransferase [Arcanobacterium bovis]TBW21432.1 TrmH family RNA methyltransferase [Arcanobacterium bovis]